MLPLGTSPRLTASRPSIRRSSSSIIPATPHIIVTMSNGFHGFRQDMPPPGGYEAVRYKRFLPSRGPSGALIFAACFTVCGLGFYRLGQGNTERRELAREKAWSRIYLVPAILAEQDRDAFRRSQAALAREKEIMKDVPGWEAGASAYHTKRFTPSNIVVL